MKLVIVESPTKANTLSRFLGNKYKIMASMGHIRDLPKKNLAIDVENNFKPQYINVIGKEKVIAGLKQVGRKAKKIILATDPDREGEAIAYSLARIFTDGSTHKHISLSSRTKIRRIVFHEITKTAIDEALENPGTINMQLVFSQQARRVLDRLVGYKLSPLLWKKIRRGLSAGRVQSPAVRLIVEREREIKDFKPEEFWIIGARLANRQNEQFEATLVKIKDKKADIRTKKQADEIKKALEKSDYLVLDLQKKESQNSPPPPFITSTLQRTASSVFKWSAKKTMRQAQTLYENGYITYHRTDSVNIADQAINMARNYIQKNYGDKFLPEKPRKYKVKSKLAQEAHEAIRITSIQQPESKINEKLGKDAAKLYGLIFKRFIACQMSNQIIAKTKVDISADVYLLKALGEKEIFKGFKILYKKSLEEKPIPELKINEKLKLIKIISEQKFTQPPARYSEGTLIKALEDRGIGRPSTYAPIISTIQTRQYVEKVEGFFKPTPVGETVTDFLVKYFENTVDYDFTAEMEDDLDKIAQKEKKWQKVLSEFYKPFAKKIKVVEKQAKRQKIEAESTGKKCPKCKKGEQVIRLGRFGRFLSCSRFPDCEWKAVYVEKLKGVKCPEDKGDIVIRKTKKGKRFFGCSNWPKCKWASWRKPQPVKTKNTQN